MQAYDPIINADVKQRHFTSTDDDQAVLMEMFSEGQLQIYFDRLKAAVRKLERRDSGKPFTFQLSRKQTDGGPAKATFGQEDDEDEASLELDAPIVRLSAIARGPMIACAVLGPSSLRSNMHDAAEAVVHLSFAPVALVCVTPHSLLHLKSQTQLCHVTLKCFTM
jgi:hypothetical protein